MMLRFNAGDWRFGLVAERRKKVLGMTSWTPTGHYLFWDFDDVQLSDVLRELTFAWRRYPISTTHPIYVFKSSEGSYQAVCYKVVSFIDMLRAIMGTDLCDLDFIAETIRWRYSTLRLLGKYPGSPELVASIPENVPLVEEKIFRLHYYEVRKN